MIFKVESCGEGAGGSNAANDLTTPPLERCYVASVLAHFPEKRPGLAFSSEIVSVRFLQFYFMFLLHTSE